MTAYRIVQGTNALKHSAAPQANVQLCYLSDSLHLRISNALTVDAPPRAGTGSLGMRERVVSSHADRPLRRRRDDVAEVRLALSTSECREGSHG